MKKVSIVMLSYNRKYDVLEGIRALMGQDYKNIEIIIADNGSTDGTTETIKENFDGSIHIIALDKNIGVAAYNLGFQKASGEYVVILDDDSFPEKKAITRMVEEFEKNSKLGVVAFDVRNYYDYSNQIHSLSNLNASKNILTPRYQLAFNGAGVGIRKKCLDEVGGYPEEFFLYWNEQDLAIRILNSGYQVQWFPDIVSLHKYSPINRESWRAPFYYTRNLYWLIWKYFPIKDIFRDTLHMIYYSIYNTLEQKTLIYLKASISAFWGLKFIQRTPAKKSIIRNLRLTYHLAFIYFR